MSPRHCRLWTALCMLLCLASGNGVNRDGLSPLDSLQCVNDYRTHTTCTWKESVAARQFVKLHLYHWQNSELAANGTCNPLEPGKNLGSHVAWTCHHGSGNKTHFSATQIDRYTFIPEPSLETTLSISPWEHFRHMPPGNLTVAPTNTSGEFLLSWENADCGYRKRIPLQDLEHEVQYKRDWEHWEDSHSLPVHNDTMLTIATQQLIPGSLYEARVRVRTQRSASLYGLWSDWSPSVSWKVPGGIPAAPNNVQCSYNGGTMMKCSWEVRAEVTESVSFLLYYREGSQQGETACHPKKLNLHSKIPIRFFSCEFLLSSAEDPGLVQISIRPESKYRSFNQCENIKPSPPSDLKADSQQDGQVYELTWNPQPLAYEHIRQRYQLCYRKIKEKQSIKGLNQLSMECPPDWKMVNISNSQSSLSFNLKTQLDPRSYYTAHVRASVVPGVSTLCYSGPWSDWSSEVSWKTEAVWDPQILFVLLIIGIIVLLFGAVPLYNYLKRSKRKWEEKIPNPSKSKLLTSFQQKGNLSLHSGFGVPEILRPGLPEYEDLRRSSLVTEGMCKGASDMAVHPSSQHHGQIHGTSALSLSRPKYQSSSISRNTYEYKLFLTGDGDCKKPPSTLLNDSGSSYSDFNGPYLLWPRSSCLSEDLTMDPQTGKQEYISFTQDCAHQIFEAPHGPSSTSVSFDYVSCPTDTESGSTVREKQEEELRKYQPQCKEDGQQKYPVPVKLPTDANQGALAQMEESPPSGSVVDYIMTPPNVLLLAPDLPSTQSSCSQQVEIPTDSALVEDLMPELAKQLGNMGSDYVAIPTTVSITCFTKKPLLESNNETEESPADRLLIISPDGISLLHQVGDYCFFPGSNNSECIIEGTDNLPRDDSTKQCLSVPPEVHQHGRISPDVEAIQTFKIMRNDYVAFP